MEGARQQTFAVRQAEADDVVARYCARCHNERRLQGNMSLEGFDENNAWESRELAEKMIRKLRAGMMPPPGSRRPPEEELTRLVQSLERQMDEGTAAAPNPGRRVFQRLNRAEYAASIRALLDLEIDPSAYLPLDTKSAGFDNIADAQLLSPTLMDSYFRAASEVSRLAVGDPFVTESEATYRVSRWASQTKWAPGTPWGSRGGLGVRHNFPASGMYRFRVSFHHETTGALFGNGRNALHTGEGKPEMLEISIDGARVALLEVPRWMHASDPDGVNLRTPETYVEAGPRQVAAAFIRHWEGAPPDLVSPHEWSLASTSIAGSYGFVAVPHLRDLAISGPAAHEGVGETPSRKRIFSCAPKDEGAARGCARDILSRLAEGAYRRPIEERESVALLKLYDAGASEGGFEEGVRLALEGILASPNFVFRIEEPAEKADGAPYPISDFDLASRLAFFLWGRGPDERLLELASGGRLRELAVLEREAARMLESPLSFALADRFAAQWLRLQDLDKIQPDVRAAPDFDESLKEAMRQETKLFFDYLVREDRPFSELLTAPYVFVNERLAKHYGIPGVAGERFRRVETTDSARRGILGHGSVLTLTSHADRTSPVLRGKWVMEVLLGTPPPPPPPDVPELEEEASMDGRLLTVRERLEEHRSNPTCNSCHRMIDPIGLALENFDVSGAWRIRDEGALVDAQGELYDGTPLETPEDLRAALLRRPEPLIRAFTENLLAYALGRRVEHFDQPLVRRIVREASDRDYSPAALVLGVVRSDAFRMKTPPVSKREEPS